MAKTDLAQALTAISRSLARLEKISKRKRPHRPPPKAALTSGLPFKTRVFLKLPIHNLYPAMEHELEYVLARWNRLLRFALLRAGDGPFFCVRSARSKLLPPLLRVARIRPCGAHPLIFETVRLFVLFYEELRTKTITPDKFSVPYFVVSGLKIVHRADRWTALIPHPFKTRRYLVLPLQKDIAPYLQGFPRMTSIWVYIGKDKQGRWWLVVPQKKTFWWPDLLEEE